ncbi:hypothetical protein PTKIN_Ptkin06aG0201300 [Pterospermum kingtungense]
MALEAAVFQQDLFSHNSKDLYSLLGYSGNWSYGFGLEHEDHKACFQHFPDNQTPETDPNFVRGDHIHHQLQHPNLSSNATTNGNGSSPALDTSTTTCSTRPKRRRSKSSKNKQEIENQRMTHIAVERNRRKQMNHYLSALRSLMPESYVQRGDQASIIGGAINFVKELEHRLQMLSAHKERSNHGGGSSCSSPPFAEFFTFPQYSTCSTVRGDHNNSVSMNESMVETQSATADIEVTMVESHANLKIRSKRRQPGQLLKLVSGLNSLLLSILHLNVSTVDHTVLYSLSVKVEEDCKLTSVDDIATALNQLLGRIQEDHAIC